MHVVNHMRCESQESIRRQALGLSRLGGSQVTCSVGPMALQSCPTLPWDSNCGRFIQGWGIGGTDLALIGAIENEPFQEHTYSMIWVSGDHIFADQIKQLEVFGISATAISISGALPNQLRKVASTIQYLPENQTLTTSRRTV